MSVSTGDIITQVFITTNPATGATADADSLPTGVLWVNGAANAATVTIADAAGTGRYTFSVTMPTLAVGSSVQVIVDATIGGQACAGEVWSDQAFPAVNVTYLAGESTPVDNLVLALQNGGYVLARLADAVTHGGGSAELTLKKAVLYNPEFGGIALLLSGDSVNGGRGVRIVGGWKAIEVDGDIDAVIEVDSLTTAALAQFVNTDTGETDAVAGSVAELTGNEAPEGSDIFIYTLTYAGGPLPGALVEAYSDEAMTQIIDYGITDAYGKVRLALDLPGTFYIKRTKVGYTFTNPDTEVVP